MMSKPAVQANTQTWRHCSWVYLWKCRESWHLVILGRKKDALQQVCNRSHIPYAHSLTWSRSHMPTDQEGIWGGKIWGRATVRGHPCNPSHKITVIRPHRLIHILGQLDVTDWSQSVECLIRSGPRRASAVGGCDGQLGKHMLPHPEHDGK